MNDMIKAALTPKQFQVARLLIEGLKGREIAKKLGITQPCAEQRLNRIYKVAELRGPGPEHKRLLLIKQLLCVPDQKTLVESYKARKLLCS